MKQLTSIFVLTLWLAGALGLVQPVQANLSEINKNIQKQQQEISTKRKERSSLQEKLKREEVEIGNVANQLQETQLSLKEITATIAMNEKEIKRLEKQEKEQMEKLKVQLDSAYRAGIHPSVLERLVSADAKEADRIMAYYGHLNKVRLDMIQELRRTQEDLKKQREEWKLQQAAKKGELSKQKKQEQSLRKAKTERESTLAQIDKKLTNSEERLEHLNSSKKALQQQIDTAEKSAQQQEKEEIAKLEDKKNREEKRQATETEKQEVRTQVRAGNGLGSPAKQYRMPVSGSIVRKFGSKDASQVVWSGVTIQASTGTPVKAIAGGKVSIASWLDGYGNVVVIDHGNGDLSVYAHNQSLLVGKDSRVQAGQTIARVGNSGGQSRSALYFEIRRKGNAVNPTKWVN